MSGRGNHRECGSRRQIVYFPQSGESKRRRVASEFGTRSWWPERSEASSCLSFTTSIFCRPAVVCCSTYSSPAANYTLPPHLSANIQSRIPHNQTKPTNSAIHTPVVNVTAHHQ